tara:strand:+ start:1104 stop:1295 length:192 start_codon:yes stop_codon:yes gene_type:complete
MKVGDLVRWESVPHQFAEIEIEYGIVIQMSRTGHETHSAQVLFMDGTANWFDTERLEIVNERG